MGIRFGRSVRLCKGVRLNLSTRRASMSFGGRGLSYNVGTRGTSLSVGLPGTGLSYRTHSSRGGSSRALQRAEYQDYLDHLRVGLDAQGNVNLVDDRGHAIPDWVDKRARRDLKDQIQDLHRKRHEETNRQTEDLLHLHRESPTLPTESEIQQALQPRPYEASPFRDPAPHLKDHLAAARDSLLRQRQNHGRSAWQAGVLLCSAGLLTLLQGSEAALSAATGGSGLLMVLVGLLTEKQFLKELDRDSAQVADQLLAQALRDWKERRRDHEARERSNEAAFATQEASRVSHLRGLLDGDTRAIEQELEWVLESVPFPLETNASFDVRGTEIVIDLDLPEIEDLPTHKSTLLSSGKSKTTEKTQKELREQYARIVHGTAFRLGGTVLASVPTCRQVVVSGYTQRSNPATGQVQDDYIYSVRLDREGYERLDLRRMDPVEAFDHFQNRRNMTKTFILKPIEPY